MSTDDIDVDPVDNLMARYTDAKTALNELERAAFSVSCPSCDPDDDRRAEIGRELKVRYNLDSVDADILLTFAAEARMALQTVTRYDWEDAVDG